MSDPTLDAFGHSDPRPAAQMLPLVYEELRRLAAARLAAEPSGNTLQPTDLVHEAYLRLAGTLDGGQWDGRGHFFAAAAEAMRRILVDHARSKHSVKRGGGRVRLDLGQVAPAAPDRGIEILDIDAALVELATVDPRAAELVKLRYFAGLSIPQAADALGISPRSADFLWAYARAWLLRSLGGPDSQT